MTDRERRYRVAFVCVKNSCRSQIAEAFARRLASDVIDPVSGGIAPGGQVDPGAVAIMSEFGIDISQARPKILPSEVLASLDLVVHMGCGGPGGCMFVPGVPSEEWGIEDPVGGTQEKYMEVARTIESKVRDLAARLRSGPPSRNSG